MVSKVFLFVAILVPNILVAPAIAVDVEKPIVYKPLTIRNYKDLFLRLQYEGIPYPELFTQVALVECGDSLNSDDVKIRNNFFGITEICAKHYKFDYERCDRRSDAAYVKFRDLDECFAFMKMWFYANPPKPNEDPYAWICYSRRYNPGDYSYYKKLKSKNFLEWDSLNNIK